MESALSTAIASLVENIAKALGDRPDGVRVDIVEGADVTVLELRTAPQDTGKVIGREGRTAKAIRTLLGAMGTKLQKRFTLDIIDENAASNAD
jgi:uncharacterized protein